MVQFLVSCVLFFGSVAESAPSCRDVFLQNLKTEVIEYGGIRYEIPVLGKAGVKLYPQEVRPFWGKSPVVASLGKIWDLKQFETPRDPLAIGVIENRSLFSQAKSLRVLELPIKLPGTEVRVPQELSQFYEFIKKAIDLEKSVNPEFDSYYAYLTVDQKQVQAGTTQRQPGVHVDGFQGERQAK